MVLAVMSPITTFIYALSDPRTNEVRYVGKANNPKSRYSRHVCAAKEKTSCHRLAWINGLHKVAMLPVLSILEECQQDVWGERETFWISQFPNLTNQLDGGKFCPMSDPAIVAKMKETKRLNPQKFSEETRKKNSLHAAKLWETGVLKPGRKASPETKAKMAAAQAKRWESATAEDRALIATRMTAARQAKRKGDEQHDPLVAKQQLN